MPQVLLTDRNVMSLAPKAGEARAEFWDLAIPSFGLRVTMPTAKNKRGKRSFFVMYRTPAGRRRRLTIGSYPAFSLAQARDQAREKLRLISESVDPQELPPVQKDLTFADLAAEYLERHAKRKKETWRDDERRLRVELLPDWGQRPAREISRRDVILVLDRVADRGAPISANRLRALISTVFNFGIGRDLVEHNPAHKVPRPGTEKPGDRGAFTGATNALHLPIHQAQAVAQPAPSRPDTAENGRATSTHDLPLGVPASGRQHGRDRYAACWGLLCAPEHEQ
jgi:hypothetical protein